jgi:hypothetical protein
VGRRARRHALQRSPASRPNPLEAFVIPDRNPADYDPAADPNNTFASAESVLAAGADHDTRGGPPAVQPAPLVPRRQSPWYGLTHPVYPPYYPPILLPPISDPGIAQRQQAALEEADLTGSRSASVNFRAHGERVSRSRALPLLEPPP